MTSVLLVSHDRDFRAVAARVLRMAGCQVKPAAHVGHALLACMQGRVPDVLVIDDRSPLRSASADARQLRRYCPEAPIVWLAEAFERRPSGDIAIGRSCTSDDLIGAVSDATHYTRRRTISR